eukprot:5830493-Prymnesium_polylepis.1
MENHLRRLRSDRHAGRGSREGGSEMAQSRAYKLCAPACAARCDVSSSSMSLHFPATARGRGGEGWGGLPS